MGEGRCVKISFLGLLSAFKIEGMETCFWRKKSASYPKFKIVNKNMVDVIAYFTKMHIVLIIY